MQLAQQSDDYQKDTAKYADDLRKDAEDTEKDSEFPQKRAQGGQCHGWQNERAV
jgi:hypothetical protein